MSTTKSYHSYLIESLKDPNEAAAYLNAALEENDTQFFLKALRNVAEAHGGINQLGELSQENPEFSNLAAILNTLGLKLEIAVKETQAAA